MAVFIATRGVVTGAGNPNGATLWARLYSGVVPMVEVTYEIVEHDGGWAYKVDGVFSEPYPTHAAALAAAQRAASEQTVPGHTETIEYEDEKGRWHTETARGSDRPHTQIKDRY
jgi:Uncharacterized protein conserved in bacteria (DUF2188)